MDNLEQIISLLQNFYDDYKIDNMVDEDIEPLLNENIDLLEKFELTEYHVTHDKTVTKSVIETTLLHEFAKLEESHLLTLALAITNKPVDGNTKDQNGKTADQYLLNEKLKTTSIFSPKDEYRVNIPKEAIFSLAALHAKHEGTEPLKLNANSTEMLEAFATQTKTELRKHQDPTSTHTNKIAEYYDVEERFYYNGLSPERKEAADELIHKIPEYIKNFPGYAVWKEASYNMQLEDFISLSEKAELEDKLSSIEAISEEVSFHIEEAKNEGFKIWEATAESIIDKSAPHGSIAMPIIETLITQDGPYDVEVEELEKILHEVIKSDIIYYPLNESHTITSLPKTIHTFQELGVDVNKVNNLTLDNQKTFSNNSYYLPPEAGEAYSTLFETNRNHESLLSKANQWGASEIVMCMIDMGTTPHNRMLEEINSKRQNYDLGPDVKIQLRPELISYLISRGQEVTPEFLASFFKDLTYQPVEKHPEITKTFETYILPVTNEETLKQASSILMDMNKGISEYSILQISNYLKEIDITNLVATAKDESYGDEAVDSIKALVATDKKVIFPEEHVFMEENTKNLYQQQLLLTETLDKYSQASQADKVIYYKQIEHVLEEGALLNGAFKNNSTTPREKIEKINAPELRYLEKIYDRKKTVTSTEFAKNPLSRKALYTPFYDDIAFYKAFIEKDLFLDVAGFDNLRNFHAPMDRMIEHTPNELLYDFFDDIMLHYEERNYQDIQYKSDLQSDEVILIFLEHSDYDLELRGLELLHEKGIDLDRPINIHYSDKKMTPMEYAVESGMDEIMTFLYENVNLSAETKEKTFIEAINQIENDTPSKDHNLIELVTEHITDNEIRILNERVTELNKSILELQRENKLKEYSPEVKRLEELEYYIFEYLAQTDIDKMNILKSEEYLSQEKRGNILYGDDDIEHAMKEKDQNKNSSHTRKTEDSVSHNKPITPDSPLDIDVRKALNERSVHWPSNHAVYLHAPLSPVLSDSEKVITLSTEKKLPNHLFIGGIDMRSLRVGIDNPSIEKNAEIRSDAEGKINKFWTARRNKLDNNLTKNGKLTPAESVELRSLKATDLSSLLDRAEQILFEKIESQKQFKQEEIQDTQKHLESLEKINKFLEDNPVPTQEQISQLNETLTYPWRNELADFETKNVDDIIAENKLAIESYQRDLEALSKDVHASSIEQKERLINNYVEDFKYLPESIRNVIAYSDIRHDINYASNTTLNSTLTNKYRADTGKFNTLGYQSGKVNHIQSQMTPWLFIHEYGHAASRITGHILYCVNNDDREKHLSGQPKWQEVAERQFNDKNSPFYEKYGKYLENKYVKEKTPVPHEEILAIAIEEHAETLIRTKGDQERTANILKAEFGENNIVSHYIDNILPHLDNILTPDNIKISQAFSINKAAERQAPPEVKEAMDHLRKGPSNIEQGQALIADFIVSRATKLQQGVHLDLSDLVNKKYPKNEQISSDRLIFATLESHGYLSALNKSEGKYIIRKYDLDTFSQYIEQPIHEALEEKFAQEGQKNINQESDKKRNVQEKIVPESQNLKNATTARNTSSNDAKPFISFEIDENMELKAKRADSFVGPNNEINALRNHGDAINPFNQKDNTPSSIFQTSDEVRNSNSEIVRTPISLMEVAKDRAKQSQYVPVDRESLRIKGVEGNVWDKAMSKNSMRAQIADLANNLKKAEMYRKAGQFDMAAKHEMMARSGAVMMSGLITMSMAAEKYGFDQKISDIIMDGAEKYAMKYGDEGGRLMKLAEAVSKNRIIANLPAFDLITTPIIYGMSAANAKKMDEKITLATQAAGEVSIIAMLAQNLGRSTPVTLAAIEIYNFAFHEVNKNNNSIPSSIHSVGGIVGELTADGVKYVTDIEDRSSYQADHTKNFHYDMYLVSFDKANSSHQGSEYNGDQIVVPVIANHAEGCIDNYPRYENLAEETHDYINQHMYNLMDQTGASPREIDMYFNDKTKVEMAFLKTLSERGFWGDDKELSLVRNDLRNYLERHDLVNVYLERSSNMINVHNENHDAYHKMFENNNISNVNIPYFDAELTNINAKTPELPKELDDYGRKHYVNRWYKTDRDYDNLTYTQKNSIIAASFGEDLFTVHARMEKDDIKINHDEVSKLYSKYLAFRNDNHLLEMGLNPADIEKSNTHYNKSINEFMHSDAAEKLESDMHLMNRQMSAFHAENNLRQSLETLSGRINDIENNVNHTLEYLNLPEIDLKEANNDHKDISKKFEEFKEYMRSKESYIMDNKSSELLREIEGQSRTLSEYLTELNEDILTKAEARLKKQQNKITPLPIEQIQFDTEEIRIFREAVSKGEVVPDGYLDIREIIHEFQGTEEQRQELNGLIQQYLEYHGVPKKEIMEILTPNLGEELRTIGTKRIFMFSPPRGSIQNTVTQPLESIDLSNIELKSTSDLSSISKPSLESNSVYSDAKGIVQNTLNNIKTQDALTGLKQYTNAEQAKTSIEKMPPMENLQFVLSNIINLKSVDQSSLEYANFIKSVASSLELYNANSTGHYINGIVNTLGRDANLLVQQSTLSSEEKDIMYNAIAHTQNKIRMSDLKIKQNDYSEKERSIFTRPASEENNRVRDNHIVNNLDISSESEGQIVQALYQMIQNNPATFDPNSTSDMNKNSGNWSRG